MTDRKLLELAAKAAGRELDWDLAVARAESNSSWHFWNPLEDGSDAFQLAVKLKLSISWDGREVQVMAENYGSGNPIGACEVAHDALSYEATTRRAIVRAAAEIGKAMP